MEREEDVMEEITLKDIEIMINILKKFVRLSREAERVLRALRPSRSTLERDFITSLVYDTLRLRQQQLEETTEEELDEETKRLIEKIRQRSKQKKDEAKAEIEVE